MKIKHVALNGCLLLLCTLALIIPTKANAQFVNGTPFQTTVNIDINNFNWTQIPIPHGKRLVIQYVSQSGAAQANPYVQPITILQTTVGGGTGNLFYFAGTESTIAPGQFYDHSPVTIYADTLEIAPAYAGYTPLYLTFNVVISGYLVPITN